MAFYEDDYESASADLIEYYGQPISYTHDGLGSTESITAEIHPERMIRRQNEYGWYWVRVREVIFAAPSGYTIREDGEVTVNSVDYVIEAIDDTLPGSRIKLDLMRAEAGEIGRPEYRR